MADPFMLDSGEYSPTEFYVASTDKSRESEVLRLRVPRHIHATIAEIVQQRTIPAYRTREDFYRDAIAHRLHWISENDLSDNETCKALLEMERERSSATYFLWMTESRREVTNSLAAASEQLDVNDPRVVATAREKLAPLLVSNSPEVRQLAHELLNRLA